MKKSIYNEYHPLRRHTKSPIVTIGQQHRTVSPTSDGLNGSCLFTARITYRHCRQTTLSLLVKSPFWWWSGRCRLLLRLLLQCAGDIEMNPGPDSTPTPTNCLRLMQWNTNGISGKITELLTFLHSNNVNIVAIQETKLTYKTKPKKTPGWVAVPLECHNNKGGGLLMLIKDMISFVDNTAALPECVYVMCDM